MKRLIITTLLIAGSFWLIGCKPVARAAGKGAKAYMRMGNDENK